MLCTKFRPLLIVIASIGVPQFVCIHAYQHTNVTSTCLTCMCCPCVPWSNFLGRRVLSINICSQNSSQRPLSAPIERTGIVVGCSAPCIPPPSSEVPLTSVACLLASQVDLVDSSGVVGLPYCCGTCLEMPVPSFLGFMVVHLPCASLFSLSLCSF